MGVVMSLECVFESSYTLEKFRSGPLGNRLDGFCDWLQKAGYSRGSTRLLVSHVSHLNQFLGAKSKGDGDVLSNQDINRFFKEYPQQARNRGPLDKHVRRVRWSIHRFVQYLQQQGRFDSQMEPPIFSTILASFSFVRANISCCRQSKQP